MIEENLSFPYLHLNPKNPFCVRNEFDLLKIVFVLSGKLNVLRRLLHWMSLSVKIYCKTLKVTVKAMQSSRLPGRRQFTEDFKIRTLRQPKQKSSVLIAFLIISNYYMFQKYVCYSAMRCSL